MYIAIEGVIGVGKTTLARLLQNTFEAEVLLEIFECESIRTWACELLLTHPFDLSLANRL